MTVYVNLCKFSSQREGFAHPNLPLSNGLVYNRGLELVARRSS